MKKAAKILLGIAAAMLAVILIYILYVFLDYHRIEDNQTLTIEASADGEICRSLTSGQEYSAMTYNIGFGAYVPEFTFFMDGGTESWAFSKEEDIAAVNGAAGLAKSYEPDFLLLEEVDLDSTRSYHVNQKELFDAVFPGYCSTTAIDFDSSFLFWPLTQPHGKSLSSMVVYSRYEITSAVRRSLPISNSMTKFMDLDRCYSVQRIPVDNGKELVMYCVHLSAYGTDASVRTGQLQMLTEDMKAEVSAGNYVICGGDFNHDLMSQSEEDNVLSWAYPLDRSFLGEHLHLALDLLSEQEKNSLFPSCRNDDIPYVKDDPDMLLVTVDGFIISDNVELKTYEQVDSEFAWSDHNPVYMTFCLTE